MSSNRRTVRPLRLDDWQHEDHLHLITSFVDSVIEFRERSRRQRVVGTLVKCQNNSYHLVNAYINGEEFGDYVINDYEISKWRVRKLVEKDRPNKNWGTNSKRTEDNDKYRIPNQLEDEGVTEGDDYLLKRFVEQSYDSEEVIDLNEDEDILHVNIESLTQKASNDIIFIDEIKEDFNDVIKKIIKSNSVGFAVFGEEVSRFGCVDLMAFATQYAIYVFDSNNRDIVRQLKPLLQSKDLQKVMFALRLPSDALYHLFDIELNNAVDVRIWDFCLQKKNFVSAKMSAKPDLRSLETLLWLYLRIKAPKVHRNINFKKFSTKIENYIRVKTVFLRELFAIINRKLLEEVYLMNSRCVRSLRSAEGLEYIAVKSDDRELEIIDNPNLAIEETEQQIISLSSNKPINGFNGREITIGSDEEVIIESDEELDEILVRLTQNP